MAAVHAEAPIFLIVAGPNGSGKSTVYANASIEAVGRSVWIINPDLLAARIRDIERLNLLEANLEAVKRIETWLTASIDAHQTVGVETVLSTDKYRKLVSRAKSKGFEIFLIYVVLDSPQLNVERVRIRVGKGGHDVPEDKILARYERSLRQLPWFLDAADRASIYDNSNLKPRLLAEKKQGTVFLDEDVPPAILRAIGYDPA